MNFKVIGSFILAAGLLSACGNGLEEGERVTLTDSISGGYTIHDYKEMEQQAIETGTWENNGETTSMLFEDYEYKITEISKKDGMVLLKAMEGSDEGTEVWVKMAELQAATEQ